MQILTNKVVEERSRTNYRLRQDRMHLLIFLNKNHQTKFKLLLLPDSVNNDKCWVPVWTSGILPYHLTLLLISLPFVFLLLGRALRVTEMITIAIVTALVLVAIIFAAAACIVRVRKNRDDLHQPLLTDQYQHYSDDYDGIPTPSQSVVWRDGTFLLLTETGDLFALFHKWWSSTCFKIKSINCQLSHYVSFRFQFHFHHT